MGRQAVSALAMSFLVLVSVLPLPGADQEAAGRIPLIYCTDLFHPPDDPDDWFDLATAFSIEELDIRGIVLDQGEKQLQRPGRIPIEQMMAITGKKLPFACGLPNKLKSPSDEGLEQPRQRAGVQEGVELIVSVLRKADAKVTIIAVGSLRDVCAAFNRDPELLREKVERLYVVAGHSGGGDEYNVQLDPHAYVGVMRSGLPIYWLPCFGKEPFVCKWGFRQGELLDSLAVKVQRYFAYGLMGVNPAKVDPLQALEEPVAGEVRDKIRAAERAMWSTPAFIDAAHRTTVKRDAQWRSVPSAGVKEADPLFRFVAAKVTVSDDGLTRFENIELNSSQPNMHLFRFEGTPDDYNRAMKEVLEGLLENLGR